MADEEQQRQQSGGEQPSEEELRAQLEEEIRKVRVEDVVLQSVVSILNLSARRIAKDDERDLDQAKVGIDAARALVDLVPAEPRRSCARRSPSCRCSTRSTPGEGSRREAEPGESAPEPGQPERAETGDSGLWTPPTG